MTADTLTISALAGSAYDEFTTITRDSGETIYAVKDSAPEWIGDMCRAAHGDMFPDDWRYDCIHSALSWISDTGADEYAELDGHEFADGHVDVYTSGRLAWLASHLDRPGYCDRAADELGGGDMDTVERIGLGQYAESLEVFGYVAAALEDQMDELAA